MARTAGKALAALLLALVGCDGGTTPDDDAGPGSGIADFERDMLASLGDEVIVPALEGFAAEAAELEAATAAYAADPSDGNREAAQAAWRETALAWQRVELMQIGPAGMSGTTSGVTGGEDRRDGIYTYEQSSTCRIDQETLEAAHADPDALAMELVNVRGLDALEYLLFVDSTDNTCSVMSPINAEGSWDALGPGGVRGARAVYAASAATLVLREANALRDAWLPSGGDFVGQLGSAGLDGSVYPTAQTALDELVGAMLYLDTDTRDMKLAEPAGIAGCPEATCPAALEAPHAAYGGALIAANVRAFQRLYLGGEPGGDELGWDDLLVEVGADALSAELATAIAGARAATEALGPSLQEAIANDPAAVMAAFDALSEVLRLFKADFFTVLDIQPAGNIPTDND